MIEEIRLLIRDLTEPYQYTDEQIETFYSLAGESVFIAAALALEAWAVSLSEQIDSERMGDYSYSKKSVDNKIKMANQYREHEASGVPIQDWSEMDLLS